MSTEYLKYIFGTYHYLEYSLLQATADLPRTTEDRKQLLVDFVKHYGNNETEMNIIRYIIEDQYPELIKELDMIQTLT